MTPADLAAGVRDAVDAVARPHRADGQKAYLKSEFEFNGATVSDLRAVAKAFTSENPDLTRREIMALARHLWEGDAFEPKLVAVFVLGHRADRLGKGDLPTLRRMLRTSHTWALVDPLAVEVVGPLLEHDPAAWDRIDDWAEDADFWVRRAALLCQLRALRRGEGDFDRFARYADEMAGETEFFIRKAIGWVLREVGKRRPDLVYAWVLPRAQRLSGVTMRETLKPLTPEQRAQLQARR